jgi:Outer membrane cobalamin receptor protein
MRKCLLIFLFASILIGNGMPLWAQEVVIRDTLRASKIEDSRIRRIVGVQVVGSDQIRNHVSPMGESDYIKFIQTLPGVSTGADGTSSIYVRGGNLGGNVVTLDGVPVYGTSHLLGFTTALSNDVVDRTEFQVGGFSSDVGNLTASHISLHSADGDMRQWHGSGSVSNFMLSAQANGPIVKDRVSAVVAARYSPLGLEFGLVDKMIPEISGLSTLVYDVYGKVHVRQDDCQTLDFTVFRSKDDYRFTRGGSTQDRMGWSNLIGRAQWTRNLGDRLSLKAIGYWSSRASLQAQEKSVVVDQSMGGIIAPDQTVKNYFSVCDSLREVSVQTQINWQVNERWTVDGGLQWRMGLFNPGASSSYSGSLLRPEHSASITDNRMTSNTWMAHAQANYQVGERVQVRGALRYSLHQTSGSYGKNIGKGEFSLLGRWRMADWIGLEGTVDHLAQFYHTLEGLPLGWSLDMVVPSDKDFAPEMADQVYGGLFGDAGGHSWSIGGYWKWMENLQYFADGGSLFNASLGSWRTGVYTGKGRSYGLEVTYGYRGKRLETRLAYTLSKTDRLFDRLNGGEWFPAKFDRRHMLNVTGDYTVIRRERFKMGVTTLVTLQSGCWETVPIGHYTVPALTGEEFTVDLYSGMNNYRMPTFFRWDAGLYLEKNAARAKHRLNLGVYNLTNRHNPFLITYDAETKEWKQISLLPILPSISYRVEF